MSVTATFDRQLDELFGAGPTVESERHPRLLATIADALAPFDVTNLWLCDAVGRVACEWPDDSSPHANAVLAQLLAEIPSAPVEVGIEAGGKPWFWLRAGESGPDRGLLIGRLAPLERDACAAVVEQLRSLEPLLRTTTALALRAGCEAKTARDLEVRVRQLTNQQEVFRAEHNKILQQSIEERECRLQEQRNYLQQLTAEVDRQTSELREQALSLQEANNRMKRDLMAAARIQQALLPTKCPIVPGTGFAWIYRPCDELAGDCLNVFRLDEHTVGMYILDVSGHGVPAALLSVTLSRVLSPLPDQSSLLKRRIDAAPGYCIVSPAQVAEQLNRLFPMDSVNEQYFTFLYALLNVQTKTLRFVSAGHPGLVHLPANEKPVVHESTGFAIGWFDDAVFKEVEVPLAAGDRVYFYSDGLTESANGEHQQFGTQRLLSAIDQLRRLPLTHAATQIVETIADWTGHTPATDDLSLLALEIG